jgi:hypothetical protein
MAVIAIVPPRGFVVARPRLIDFSKTLTPPMGGETQRLRRLGTRWALSVQLPVIREGEVLAALIADILAARNEGASYPWPQPGIVIGTPGAPAVNGAGQTGSAINLRGFAAGYSVRKGQFFSVTVSGRRYLHQFSAARVADGGGFIAGAAIFPMLRRSPGDGAILDLNPVIEGDITADNADGFEWEHDRDDQVPLQFSIVEAA